MIITICGSIKFIDEMRKAKKALEKLGHKVYLPDEVKGVDYWAEDNTKKVEIKRKFNFIREHMDKIKDSDAILVVNVTKKDIKNYIGANTFLEMGFAYYRKKKVYTLNPFSEQIYILDEILAIDPIVLDGDLTKIG